MKHLYGKNRPAQAGIPVAERSRLDETGGKTSRLQLIDKKTCFANTAIAFCLRQRIYCPERYGTPVDSERGDTFGEGGGGG